MKMYIWDCPDRCLMALANSRQEAQAKIIGAFVLYDREEALSTKIKLSSDTQTWTPMQALLKDLDETAC